MEVWLDPLDTAEVSCRSLFQTIMDYFDKSDKLTLQSLQVFHSIQDAHRNNVLSLRGSRRVEQSHMNAVFRYSSRSRHSRCAVEDFRVQEFPFDILPLMRNARPCFVPLRFPHGRNLPPTWLYCLLILVESRPCCVTDVRVGVFMPNPVHRRGSAWRMFRSGRRQEDCNSCLADCRRRYIW